VTTKHLHLGACAIVYRGCWGTKGQQFSLIKINAKSSSVDSKVPCLQKNRPSGLGGIDLREYFTIFHSFYFMFEA